MTETYDDIDFGDPNPVRVPATWTMTDAEFDEELRKAKEAAWDEGHNHCFRVENPVNAKPYNPYRKAA